MIEEMREKIARMPIASQKYDGKRFLTLDTIDQLLNLKTATCHISICKNEPEVPEIPHNILPSYPASEVDTKCRITQMGMLDAGFEQKA